MSSKDMAMEIQAKYILKLVREMEMMSPRQRLDYARDRLIDEQMTFCTDLGFGLALIVLMEYWKECDENIKDFIRVYNELMELYSSSDAEDRDKIGDYFVELHKRTGFLLGGKLD